MHFNLKYLRVLKKGANGHAAKSTFHGPIASNPDRAVNQVLRRACNLTFSFLCVKEHCVLMQQTTKQKETVRVLNMIHDGIVAVGFDACHHVSIGCIPDVGVSVSRTKKNLVKT